MVALNQAAALRGQSLRQETKINIGDPLSRVGIASNLCRDIHGLASLTANTSDVSQLNQSWHISSIDSRIDLHSKKISAVRLTPFIAKKLRIQCHRHDEKDTLRVDSLQYISCFGQNATAFRPEAKQRARQLMLPCAEKLIIQALDILF
jgi:hypothetical protein